MRARGTKIRRVLSGFTLIEMMVVVIIIGIFAALAIPSYTTTKEKVFDKEAITVLRLIRTANRQYQIKFNGYFTKDGSWTPWSNSPFAINGNLSTDINSINWYYRVAGGGGFTAQANRTSGASRIWSINQATDTPSCAGSCL